MRPTPCRCCVAGGHVRLRMRLRRDGVRVSQVPRQAAGGRHGARRQQRDAGFCLSVRCPNPQFLCGLSVPPRALAIREIFLRPVIWGVSRTPPHPGGLGCPSPGVITEIVKSLGIIQPVSMRLCFKTVPTPPQRGGTGPTLGGGNVPKSGGKSKSFFFCAFLHFSILAEFAFFLRFLVFSFPAISDFPRDHGKYLLIFVFFYISLVFSDVR